MKKYEVEIWYLENELRQFIDIASRWGIAEVYKGRTVENPYSNFDNIVKDARYNFELFCTQLKISLTENQNWKAIEIDVKDRFLPMINKYINWYNDHRKETELFNPYNPYKIMFSITESTKREILKYFPTASMETTINNWNDLYKAFINNYIRDVSENDFNETMEYKRLPNGKKQITWCGRRYEGFWFGKYARFDENPTGVKNLNKCFIPSDGKPFRSNDNTLINSDFEKLLLKYFGPLS